MSKVDIQDIQKSFGALSILKGVDLAIKPGEFIVLLGPSGCGKSTLLNIIAGLEAADSGHILIDDRDMTTADPSQRGLAMVFQSYALFPTMTVRQNLGFGLKIAGTPKGEIVSRVQSVADLLQISALLDRKPAQLSGGQRQRVAIGRALVRSTKLCLFDEPLSNLDAQLRSDMRVELRRLHGELRSTMIYVTHDQIEAMTLANRVAVMRNGKVEQFDTPQVVYDSPESLFVAKFVGSPSINLMEGTLNDGGRFESPGGITLDVSSYPFRQPIAQQKHVVLGVRPDHIKPTAEAPASFQSIPARQTFVEALGPRSLMWVDVNGERWGLYVDVNGEDALDRTFNIAFDATRISIFDKETGERL